MKEEECSDQILEPGRELIPLDRYRLTVANTLNLYLHRRPWTNCMAVHIVPWLFEGDMEELVARTTDQVMDAHGSLEMLKLEM